uniref:G-protein coupled receptors family 2 profile 2 domain-containing protein n=1 Tax=Ciona savignyi TaxID=51511 RepID=H2YAB1_CIOSA
MTLLFSYLFFTFGINNKQDFTTCLSVAILLHYFWLATWCWMAVESYTMYLLLVKVICNKNSQSCIIRRGCLFSYVTPALVVTFTVLYSLYKVDVQSSNSLENNSGHNDSHHWSSYLSDDACWVKGSAFYFGFLLPISMILVYNFAVFINVVYSLSYRQAKLQSTAKQLSLRKRLSNVITMTTLLGLPWLLGLVGNLIHEETVSTIIQTIHVL